MSEAISSGASYAASSDITVTGGTPKSLYIHTATPGADIAYDLQHKSNGGTYQTIERLTLQNINEKGTISGAGTFRLVRVPGANASSIDVE